MIKTMTVLSIAFLIVFSAALSGADPLDIPEPDALPETYLKGNEEERKQQCRNEVALSLGEECSSCHNDDVTDFTEKGNKAKEDMDASVAIGVKCDYCHAGKRQFTDKAQIAEKMFELSALMDVKCSYCHAGKETLTFEGKTSKTAMLLQKWAETGSRKCLECHDEKKKFELNFHGWEILNAQKGLLGM